MGIGQAGGAIVWRWEVDAVEENSKAVLQSRPDAGQKTGERELVTQEGRTYLKSSYAVDFGKAGTAHVTVLDPCVSEEAQQRRREHLRAVCEDLIRRGLA